MNGTEAKTAAGRKERTAAFSMGCFWSPEALFGAQEGVLATQTGYAGGSSEAPTYREMGDYSETVLVRYDAAAVSYEELLRLFREHHDPANTNGYKGRQYQSIVHWSEPEQLAAIEGWLEERRLAGLPEPDTEIRELGRFFPAEERHQKYYLKRYPDAWEKLLGLYPSRAEAESSRLACRLNGLAKGFANRSALLDELERWIGEAPERRRELAAAVRGIRW
ncbi:peptide-methionine (S)-S-oxide reductase MsrA [Paenibacillus sp. B01]|uniref:peptide-methionine (S)-S-oxide reductase MsrA n=1 Tax=Paenibacillus sp. B01 TaxID=2660554 RepID=UPI00129B7319|nr:peptide-methionine (S)-S-oxide reductase [Paenibacillus sp. B01]QGG54452.1 peptide methionine sulfoxide reductase [Paenibacillus sp. B01]